MRIGIGGIIKESHSFSPASSSLDRFKACLYLKGAQVFERLGACNHEIAGGLDEIGDGTPVPLFFAATASNGRPLDDETLGHLQRQLLDAIDAGGAMDGLLLVMHGAMASEIDDDATGYVLESVRNTVGPDMPIVATIDLHANVTQRMVDVTNAMVFYHTQPHIDQGETGSRAMRLLKHIIRDGVRPAKAFRSLPMMVPGENGRTTVGPYHRVMQEVIALEARPEVCSAGACAAQPWLDLPDYGCSVIVYTDGDPELAQREADRIARLFWEVRHEFTPALVEVEEAIARAATPGGPLIFSDSADAPGSGAPGDSTVLLKALLDAGFDQPALLNIVDAPAVDAAQKAGVGEVLDIEIGATFDQRFYQPLHISARVAAVEEGVFKNESSGNTGLSYHMDGVAVLQCGSMSVVAMRQGVVQWDPALYRCVGLDPASVRVVQVKSPAAFRHAYGPLAEDILVLNAPGHCSPNFQLFPWKRVRRPLFPLDDIQSATPWLS